MTDSNTKPRVTISRDDLLKAFNPRDSIPQMMVEEMQDVQPLTHLLSKYIIKPVSFDANPYYLPRAAQYPKYGGKQNFNRVQAKYGDKGFTNAAGQPVTNSTNATTSERKTSGGEDLAERNDRAQQVQRRDGPAIQRNTAHSNRDSEGFVRRPQTGRGVEANERRDFALSKPVVNNEIDDFETVEEKPKKVARAPYNKFARNAETNAITNPTASTTNPTSTATATSATPAEKTLTPASSETPKTEEKTVEIKKPQGNKPVVPKEEPKVVEKVQKVQVKDRVVEEQKENVKVVSVEKKETTVSAENKPNEPQQAASETISKETEPPAQKESDSVAPQQPEEEKKVVRKGPRPRGLAKFKPVKVEAEQIEESEMSQNQKRKLEERKRKQLEEEAQKKRDLEAKRAEELKIKQEKERLEQEERRKKTEAMFMGLAKANELNSKKVKSTANFDEIMAEQQSVGNKRAEQQAATARKQAQGLPGFQLNYLKEADRIIGSHTAAGAAKPDFAALNKGKKKK